MIKETSYNKKLLNQKLICQKKKAQISKADLKIWIKQKSF